MKQHNTIIIKYPGDLLKKLTPGTKNVIFSDMNYIKVPDNIKNIYVGFYYSKNIPDDRKIRVFADCKENTYYITKHTSCEEYDISELRKVCVPDNDITWRCNNNMIYYMEVSKINKFISAS